MPLTDPRHPAFYDDEAEIYVPQPQPPKAKVDSKLGLGLIYAGHGIDYATDLIGKWTTNFIVALLVGLFCYHVGSASASVKELKATANIKADSSPKAPAPTTTTVP